VMRGAESQVIDDGEFNKVSELAASHMTGAEPIGSQPADSFHTHEVPRGTEKNEKGPSGSEMVKNMAHSKGQQLVSFQVRRAWVRYCIPAPGPADICCLFRFKSTPTTERRCTFVAMTHA